MQLDLGELGFEEGGHLLVKRSLRQVPVGDEIEVTGQAPELDLHLRTWCRSEGHHFGWVRGESVAGHAVITRGGAETNVLRHTAGLNAEVFDALLLLAAGSWNTDALRQGHQRVMDLTRDMDRGRKSRLLRLGFSEAEAAELSSLHTRNFM